MPLGGSARSSKGFAHDYSAYSFISMELASVLLSEISGRFENRLVNFLLIKFLLPSDKLPQIDKLQMPFFQEDWELLGTLGISWELVGTLGNLAKSSMNKTPVTVESL